ncbi:MAG TPA: AAA family ATPase [Burkholderiales bacterium]|nr:AAA family ATPase [Burkholderiales bacterium]
MNYLSYFGLRELPFGITPDTHFFFAGRASQEALNTLVVAIGNGEGFVKVTGEVGTGKTLLCRKLLASLQSRYVSAYIPNPSFGPKSLLIALADELALPLEPDLADIEPHRLLRAVTRALLDIARQGKRVVLCMDESQSMSLETLEALRLLTNVETEKMKLLQVVLFGQPELDVKLASSAVRQLRQRIIFEHRLHGLERDEVGAYVTHRLVVAGYSGAALLNDGAVSALHRASRGVPRLINVLMHKAMLLAYGEGVRALRASHVRAAIADTPSAMPERRWWPLAAKAA